MTGLRMVVDEHALWRYATKIRGEIPSDWYTRLVDQQMSQVRAGRALRPGWLADDDTWCEQWEALTDADRVWFAAQWELAGGLPPGWDVSWLTTERIR